MARPLGLIAFEMMEQGSPPETEEKLVLRHPGPWSPEASNFLYITNWGTLKDIEEVRKVRLFLAQIFLTALAAQIYKEICVANGHGSIY